MSRHRTHAVALLIGAALLGLARRGSADAGTVSLLGVSGAGGDAFAKALERDLAELYEVVPGERYRITAERLSKRGASAPEVRAVCGSLRVDGLIAGAVGGGGLDRQLTIVVREGVSGQVISRKPYDLSTRTLQAARESVVSDLVRTLNRVRRLPPPGQVAVEDETAVEDEVKPSTATADLAPASVIVRGPSVTVRTLRPFTVGVGPSLMTRSLAFDVRSAPGYSGGTVAGIRVEGNFFPIAMSTELADAHPVLASFGLSGMYEHAFDFTSTNVGGSSAGHASRWSAMVIGRIPLGHAARGGELTIETGFQRISWGSGSGQTLGVPDVTYALFDAGLEWQRDLGTRYVSMSIRLAGMALVDAGQISDGAQYGPAHGGGLDAEVGLTVRPVRWLWLRVAARYTPLFIVFGGAGDRLAGGAKDQFASGALEAGFAL